MTKAIGIDIREAGEAAAGKGRYTEKIVEAMIRRAPQHFRFVLFSQKKNPSFPNSSRVEQVLIPGRGFKWHWNLRRYLLGRPVDFYLSTTSFIYPALIGRSPISTSPSSSAPIAIVVHDLVAFFYKEHHWFPKWVERLTLSRAIRNSRFLITISESTRKDLAKWKPESRRKKVILAYPGADKSFHPPARHARSASGRLKLPARYFFAIGTLQPRKNMEGILKAFSLIAEQNADLHLCIAGGGGWKMDSIKKAVPDSLKNRIHFLGHVRGNELPELYSRALALVFPSFYEGFGIPIVEAMASGCPVITSNISSMPEVAGDAAILVDPKSTEEIAQAMQTVLSPKKRQLLVERGLKRAEKFSWEHSAEEILKAIESVI